VLIGDIYDCVFDPGHWEPTLARIMQELSFVNSVLGVLPFRPGGQVVNVSVGFDPEWLAIADADSYRAEALALWGGAERMQGFPLDEPIVHSEAVGVAMREGNRYYREILRPRELCDAVLITVAREPSLMGYVAFNRHSAVGEIGELEVQGLRLLAPHFRRAVTISNLFDMQAIEAKAFRSTLDAVAFGVLIVDEALRVLHANAAAEAMLAVGTPLRTQGRALVLQESSTEAILLDAVTRAARDETTIGQKGIGVPMTGAGGEALVLHVLPLRQGSTRSGLVTSAAAAIFVAADMRPLRMPIDAIALLYDLTPAEVRVFELVCDGVAPQAIAAQLGIVRSTVKTHLERIFQKTGCHRQAGLIRLAAGFSL
jgi:DNA-binding CsgD family transcriptional regulator